MISAFTIANTESSTAAKLIPYFNVLRNVVCNAMSTSDDWWQSGHVRLEFLRTRVPDFV